MFTFKHVFESFDKHLAYSKDYSKDGHHEYSFSKDHTDPEAGHFTVHIDHSKDKPTHASTMFHDQDVETGVTGKHRGSAHKVFSTVGHILGKHAVKHGITHYSFQADASEPSRVKLYRHMARKFDANHTEKMVKSDGAENHEFTVAV